MSNTPATWAGYRAALVAYETAFAAEPGSVGLGYVFAKLDTQRGSGITQRHVDEFVFVDLDHCRDPETGEIEG
jgi:primase-polymerase (primpol)-like protein